MPNYEKCNRPQIIFNAGSCYGPILYALILKIFYRQTILSKEKSVSASKTYWLDINKNKNWRVFAIIANVWALYVRLLFVSILEKELCRLDLGSTLLLLKQLYYVHKDLKINIWTQEGVFQRIMGAKSAPISSLRSSDPPAQY